MFRMFMMDEALELIEGEKGSWGRGSLFIGTELPLVYIIFPELH